MTPSAEVAPPSFDSMLDSIASTPTASSTQAAPTPPATEDDAAPTEEPPSPDQLEAAEAPAPTAEEAPTELEPPELNQPDVQEGVKPWGKEAFHVTKPRMEQFVANDKFVQEVQRFAPTVKEAHEHYLTANDLYEMRTDFGDPEKLDQWAGYWERENPNSFAELVARLPERVKQSHPEIYSQFQQKVLAGLKAENPNLYGDITKRAVQERVDALYDEWASFDPVTQKAQAESARYRAQMADQHLNGSYRNEVTRIDPIERQRRELEAREQKFQKEQQEHKQSLEKREETARQQTWTNWEQGIEKEKATGLSSEITSALKSVEKSFSKEQLDAFRDRIENVVKQRMKEDFEWSRNRDLDLTGMKRTTLNALKERKPLSLKPAVKAYLDNHSAYAKPIIAETARVLINRTTAKVVADNQAQHQRSASGQKPGVQGNRPPTSSFKAAKPSADQSFEDKFEAIGRGERR